MTASSPATVMTLGARTYHPESPLENSQTANSKKLAEYYLLFLLVWIIVIAIYRSIRCLVDRLRKWLSFAESSQRYLAIPQPLWNRFKLDLLYAPMLRNRRRRPLMFRNIRLGFLPDRCQSIFIAILFATNVFLCTYKVQWHSNSTLRLQFLVRFATIAITNLIPLVTIATVRNPLIICLNVSFDSFNLFHRWLGRITICEILGHITCAFIGFTNNGGLKGINHAAHSSFIRYGLVAGSAFISILFLSPSFLRHRFYEVFLHCHIILVITAMTFIWLHTHKFSQVHFVIAALSIWTTARAVRFVTLVYRSVGRGGCHADLELVSEDMVKVSLTCPRPWRSKPGQYIYLTIPEIGLWTAHPFSIAWAEQAKDKNTASWASSSSRSFNDPEKLASNHPASPNILATKIHLLIRPQVGFTRTLHRRPIHSTSRNLLALIEGPYPTPDPSLSAFNHILLIAGGTGISHQLPYVRTLLLARAAGLNPLRRLALVWVVRNRGQLSCIKDWFDEILAIDGRRDVLRVQLHVTWKRDEHEEGRGRAEMTRTETGDSVTERGTELVELFYGAELPGRESTEGTLNLGTNVTLSYCRPDVQCLVRDEAEARIGCMGVSCCGPAGMMDEVRAAVRQVGRESSVEWWEVGFGW